MNRNIRAICLLAMVPMLTMCHPATLAPISRICRYDGASSGTTVKVICTGIGNTNAKAYIDAKKAAMWFVASKMLQTHEERQRFSMHSNSFYIRHNTFLNSANLRGGVQSDDSGRIIVQAMLEVNRQAVVTFFKYKRIADPQLARKVIGNPTIAVVARWKVRDPRWDPFTRNSVNEFLTSRRYNAVDVDSGMKKLNKMGQQVLSNAGIPGDKNSKAAMVMGADIYLELTAWNTQKNGLVKGAASVKAYETTTRRLLGSSTGFGREYSQGNQMEFKTVKEAIQNTVEKVLNHVMNYWKHDAATGNRYYLLIAGRLNAVEDMGDLLTMRLKKLKVQCGTSEEKKYCGVSGLKRTTKTASRITITFQTKIEQTELSLALKKLLRRSPGVRSLRVPLTTRKFFVILINHAKPTGGNPDSLPPGI